MSSKVVILDSSALLALLQEEKGCEVVHSVIDRAVMSSVNVAEVLTVLGRNRVDTDEALILVEDILNDIKALDVSDAKEIADLKVKFHNKGLSLGDAACIALGVKLGAAIYTADKIWGELDFEGADIKLIR